MSHDHPHEGATERTELVGRLKKFLSSDDNRAFNQHEWADITKALRELQAEVRTLAELNIKQKEELNQSLKKLESSSKEMGRKDWLMYGIGVVTTIVIAEFVPPLALLLPAVHFVHAIGHLFVPDA